MATKRYTNWAVIEAAKKKIKTTLDNLADINSQIKVSNQQIVEELIAPKWWRPWKLTEEHALHRYSLLGSLRVRCPIHAAQKSYMIDDLKKLNQLILMAKNGPSLISLDLSETELLFGE